MASIHRCKLIRVGLAAVFALSLSQSPALGGSEGEGKEYHEISQGPVPSLRGDLTAGNTTQGTINYPNGGLLKQGIARNLNGDEDISVMLIDTGERYAYLAANNSPKSRILKFDLDRTPDLRVAATVLELSDAPIRCGVIDEVHGYAYFATDTNPGRIIKVALGEGDAPAVRVGSLALNLGEARIQSAVIDVEAGYAYFGTMVSPGQFIKVALGEGDNPPTRVGAVSFVAGADGCGSAVIDVASGYAYVGTDSIPGRVVKVALGSGDTLPSVVSTLTLETGENQLRAAIIDTDAGYAYFGTTTAPGKVVKVALGSGSNPSTRIGAIEVGGNNLTAAVLFPNTGYAIFGGGGSGGGRVSKVLLGVGDQPPTYVSYETTGPGIVGAALDPGGIIGRFVTNASPGRIDAFRLGAANEPPDDILGIARLETGDFSFESGIFDEASGDAIFTTNVVLGVTPSYLVRMDSEGVSPDPPNRLDDAELDNLKSTCSVVDNTRKHVYVGHANSHPGGVSKYDISGSRPALLHSANFSGDEDFAQCGAIDVAAGYTYWGTNTSPGHVVKMDMENDEGEQERIGGITLELGEGPLYCVALDPASGYGYFGTSTSPGRIVKVRLETGDVAPTRIGSITLPTGENDLRSVVIDTAGGYAYFGTNTSPGKIVKVALGAGDAFPSRVAALTLEPGENNLRSAIIEPDASYAYFGTYTMPSRLVKVGLGSGTNPPIRRSSIIFDNGTDNIESAVMDHLGGRAFFGTATEPAIVPKVVLGQKGFMKANRLEIPAYSEVTDLHFYSHASMGNVRLALYNDKSPKQLVWQSGPVANSVTGGELIVPIASGIPDQLVLYAGTYWLGWQVDTNADVASYAVGNSGDGFLLPMYFGDAPAEIEAAEVTPTNELWTAYVSYSLIPPTTGWRLQGDE